MECLFFREDMMFNKDSTTTRREFVKRVGAIAGATLFLGQSTLKETLEIDTKTRGSALFCFALA